MPDKTVQELDAVGTLGGTESFHIVDSDGNSREVTLAALKTFINTDPTVVPSSEPFRGALVNRTSAIDSVSNVGTIIPWQSETYDTDAIWSGGAPTRLTVPTGVTRVKLSGQVLWENLTGIASALIIKNGTLAVADYPGQAHNRFNSATSTIRMQLFTAVLPVTAGDYFELQSVQVSGSNKEIGTGSWFAMEIVQG